MRQAALLGGPVQRQRLTDVHVHGAPTCGGYALRRVHEAQQKEARGNGWACDAGNLAAGGVPEAEGVLGLQVSHWHAYRGGRLAHGGHQPTASGVARCFGVYCLRWPGMAYSADFTPPTRSDFT